MTARDLSELFRLREERRTYRDIAAALGISARRASRIYRRLDIPGVSPEYTAAVRQGQLDLVDLIAAKQG
jgi:hypothetical protein